MSVDEFSKLIDQIFNSNILTLSLQATVIYVALLWIAIIIWVARDANNRSNSIFLQIFAVLLVIIFTPLLGLFLYLMMRPAKTITERYVEEIYFEMLEEKEKQEQTDEDDEEMEEEPKVRKAPRRKQPVKKKQPPKKDQKKKETASSEE